MDSKQRPKQISSKAVKRLESKKRKIEAFLDLTKKLKDDMAVVPMKQPKLDGDVEEDASSSLLNTKSLEQLKQEQRARQKASMMKPKLYLTLEDLQVPSRVLPSFAMCETVKTEPCYLPLFVMDLQHLLVYAIQGNTASYKPRWCKLLRWSKVSRVIVLVLNDVSVSEYNNYSESFPFTTSTFQMKVEMVSPSDYGSTVLQELFHVPWSISHLRKSIKDRTRQEYKAHREELKNVVAVDLVEGEKVNIQAKEDGSDSSNLLDFLLSPQQMIEEAYPLPVSVENSPGYIYSHEKYDRVTKNSPLFAVDCEMCLTTSNKLELTRVSIVNEKLEVVYDTLVKPHNKIVNYLTRYSGITKALLKGVTTRLADVQKTFREILPSDAVVCGHSLNGDLHTLKMYHPYVIDTSVIYNLAGRRKMKPGLKRLAAHFLDKNIQQGDKGHDPTEDAAASMELVLLKLQKGYDFGDTVLAGLTMSQGTRLEEEEVEQAASSLKRTHSSSNQDNDKTETECREASTVKCSGCENCRENEGDSAGDSDEDCSRKDHQPCTKCEDAQTSSGDRGNDQCNSSCSESGAKRGQNSKDGIVVNRKTVFFERPGTKYGKHLCVVCKENKHSVSLIGAAPEFADAMKTCSDEASSDMREETGAVVSHVATASDKKTAKLTKRQLCSNSFMTVASFHGFTPYCPEQEKKAQLKELDKCVSKVLKRAPSNSLVCVVLGGHSDPLKSHAALSLVKIVP